MIVLKRLKWDNCFSYGEGNELELDSNTITQIIGTNGAGKSSIPLIIEEVLYNKNSKGIKKADIPNRYAQKGYQIYLSWEKDNDFYEIRVNRKGALKVRLEKNGEDISSHTATNTYKTVQEVLGVDFKTFSQLVYQSSSASLQFLTATDTNRKKFLIDLLHLEEYVRLFEVFKSIARDVNSDTVRIEANIATVEKWLSDNKLTDTTILPMLDLEIDTEDDEKELRKLSIEITNISEKNRKISENNQYKKLLNNINLSEAQNAPIDKLESYDKETRELGTHQQAITSSKKMTSKFTSLGDVCPTCEQPVDSEFVRKIIAVERARIEEAQKACKGLDETITLIKKNNEQFRKNSKIQKEWEEIYRSINKELPSDLLDANTLSKQLASVQTRLSEAKSKLNALARENEKRTKQNTRIQIIQEQTESFEIQLADESAKLKVQKELSSNIDILKKAFSTNGLLAYKIENLVKDLETLANTYLAELSDGKFTLEFIVSNDKLDVQITDEGNIVDILALSSGEQARVNTATLIAIRKLMSSISESRINVLFLDEVINVLDENGREKLIEVLLKEENLNTYIVSHGYTHPLLEKIEVVKRENTSELEK